MTVVYQTISGLLMLGNIELGETSSAINALEAIPLKWRTCAANLCLGRLLRNAGLKRNSINAYKEALRQNPLALEAVTPLVQLGVSSEISNKHMAAQIETDTAQTDTGHTHTEIIRRPHEDHTQTRAG